MTDDDIFEAEVRHVAGLLYPSTEGSRLVEGIEHDGIFITEDLIVIVEATTSTTKQKAHDDVRDIDKSAQKLLLRYSDKVVKGFVVTRQDPTAHQLEEAGIARNCKVQILSFDRFRHKLVDARTYLELRKGYRFGSASNDDAYIPLTLLERTASGAMRNSDGLTHGLGESKRYVLLGDFGAGKSMTLRDVWKKLARDYQSGRIHRFPILLNLRDHQGQKNPAEALERHATNIGFEHRSQLVRAWRAGQVNLLLDGFDEFVSQPWTGRLTKLKAARYESVSLIRALIKDSPSPTGIILAGRQHYFDSEGELRSALGIDAGFVLLDVQEFADEQVHKYLRSHGILGNPPDWLPARPLFLNYLLSHEKTRNAILASETMDPHEGWIHIVDSMCAREAQIEAGLDLHTIRKILQRLASQARVSFSGLGPISQVSIRELFRQICGVEPDDQSSLLLQRLPGLGVYDTDPEARQFIDEDLVDILRAGDVVTFIEPPFSEVPSSTQSWNCGLNDTGLRYAAACTAQLSNGQLSAALERAAHQHWYMLAADILRIHLVSERPYEGANCEIFAMLLPELDLSSVAGDLSRVSLNECIIGTLRLSTKDQTTMPVLQGCLIECVEGRISDQDLPPQMLDCSIDKFMESVDTTNRIMVSGLNIPIAVCITVLRKLFVQRGAARRERSFFRGLDDKSQRYVNDVLEAVEREGFATKVKLGDNIVWRPMRNRSARVRQMLLAPSASEDSLMIRVRALVER